MAAKKTSAQLDRKKLLSDPIMMGMIIVLLVFYVLGCIIKRIMEAFEAENEARAKEEGEVIEKESTEENGERVSEEVEKN